MAEKLYLMSGHTSTGRLKELDRRALLEAHPRKVLVINLSSQKAKAQAREDFFRKYFRDLGAEFVETIEEDTEEFMVEQKFLYNGLVYLPGGDTETLIQNIRDKGLVSHLKSFGGIISGNGAGAYAMCPDYLRIGHGAPEIIPSLGMVPFWTKAHYEPKFDQDLMKLSEEGRVIYAIENESAVVVGNGHSFIGNVWLFHEGRKEQISSAA